MSGNTIKPDVTKPMVNTKNEQVCFATLQFEDEPWSYENYLKTGGYTAWRKILKEKISPEDVVEETRDLLSQKEEEVARLKTALERLAEVA